MTLAAFDQFNHRGGHGPDISDIPFFPLLAPLAIALLGLLALALFLWRRKRRGDDTGPATPPAAPSDPTPPSQYSSPLQTLEDRYVRGQIDQAEFEHRRNVLKGVSPQPPPQSVPPLLSTDLPSAATESVQILQPNPRLPLPDRDPQIGVYPATNSSDKFVASADGAVSSEGTASLDNTDSGQLTDPLLVDDLGYDLDDRPTDDLTGDPSDADDQ